MSLTPEDIQTIRMMLEAVRNDLSLDVSTVSQKIDKVEKDLTKQIQTTEANLKGEIQKLDIKIQKVDTKLDNLSKEIVRDLIPMIVTHEEFDPKLTPSQ